MNEKLSLEFKGFLSGAIGSWCGILVGQPFDIIKVRVQNNGGSALQTLKNLLKYEGALTLWKGSLAPIIGLSQASALSFGTNENVKRVFSSYNKPNEVLSISQHAMCGTISGFMRAFIACPVEHIRIKMQIQGKIDPRGDPHYKNSISCFTTIWSNYKINGLYKGFSVTMVRELIGITMYFTAYHYSGRKIFGDSNKNTDELEKHKIFVCGAIAGYAYWMVYPLDVIKSKIQSDSLSNPKFKSIQDCIRSTYNAGGWKGFYRGFLPCILRAGPANAAIILGFETSMSFFGRDYK